MSPRHVQVGPRQYIFPSPQLEQLEDCNHLLASGNYAELRKELKDKGYLFIRGLHDRNEVLQARLAVLKYVNESGADKLDKSRPWQDGVLNHRCGLGCIPFMEGMNPISLHEDVLKVIDGSRPRQFFEHMFGEKATTFNFKWLRGVHNGAFTGVHVDNVYMGRGTDQLLTMWTPMGDITVEMGTLVMCEKSHTLDSFQKLQDTYGSLDVEKEQLEGTGWFTEDPMEITQQFGGQWKTSDFQAGDVLIFSMRTVHMSSVNTTNLLRISCDTRWQPSSHKIDTRFMVEREIPKNFGLYADDSGSPEESKVTMKSLRALWGI